MIYEIIASVASFAGAVISLVFFHKSYKDAKMAKETYLSELIFDVVASKELYQKADEKKRVTVLVDADHIFLADKKIDRGEAGVVRTVSTTLDSLKPKPPAMSTGVVVNTDKGRKAFRVDLGMLAGKTRRHKGSWRSMLKKLSALSEDEQKKVIEELQSQLYQKEKNRPGFVEPETLVYIVPAFLTFTFVIAFFILLIANKDTANYECPKELSRCLTMSLGYYFGVGASKAAKK